MGRYSITKKRTDVEREIAARLRVRLQRDDLYGRFNVAPTQEVPAVVQDRRGRRAEVLRWGLVPRWAKEVRSGHTMINARAETLAASPAFSGLCARGTHRCLVVADGFYEWMRSEDPRQAPSPLHFALADGASFCFAGLWTTWKSPAAEAVRSCTIVTTTPNELVAPAHDRMPVVLNGTDACEAWLDPALDGEAVAPLLTALPAELMAAARANPVVNSADHEGPDCLVAPAV